MLMTRREITELALSKAVLIIVAIIGLGVVVWLAWLLPARRAANVHSYESCVAAGNPVQQTYPRTCATAHGQRFVDPAVNLPRQ